MAAFHLGLNGIFHADSLASDFGVALPLWCGANMHIHTIYLSENTISGHNRLSVDL